MIWHFMILMQSDYNLSEACNCIGYAIPPVSQSVNQSVVIHPGNKLVTVKNYELLRLV